MSSSLLINEPPLQVLPSLAKLIGLNEAIVIQQVHYWLGKSKNKRDGRTWVYKTYPEWREEFPFWSEDTIGRVIRKLEKTVLLIGTDKYNAVKTDRTKWYSIHYENLNSLLRVPQDATLDNSNLPPSTVPQDATLLPETTQKNTAQESTAAYPLEDRQTTLTFKYQAAYDAYQRWIGPIPPTLLKDIDSACERYSPNWLIEAAELTQQRYVEGTCRKPSLTYMLGILKAWADNGYDGKNSARNDDYDPMIAMWLGE